MEESSKYAHVNMNNNQTLYANYDFYNYKIESTRNLWETTWNPQVSNKFSQDRKLLRPIF